MATKKEETPTPEDLGLPPVDVAEAPSVDAESAEAPKKRGRGRPPGSGTKKSGDAPKKSASRKSEDMDALARQLVGIHQLIAMATGLGELVISEQEAGMLAKGITAVTEEYGFALTGKTGAALQLFGAAAIVYVPRAIAVKARADAARRAAEEEAANTLDGAGLVHAAAH